MRSLKLKWNSNGSTLAVSGIQTAKTAQGEEKELSIVQFYTPNGQFQRFLKVPGKKITSLSWEHNGLRIALAVDSFIYFANVRPDHKWTHFANDVVVYTYNRIERVETIIIFWNTKTEEKYSKYVNSRIYFVCSFADNCLIVTKSDDNGDEISEKYLLTIYNAIGTNVDVKEINFEPKCAAITKSHVIVSSNEIVVTWQFKVGSTSTSSSVSGGSKYSAFDGLNQINLSSKKKRS